MIAVIFEVWPERREDYLDIAAEAQATGRGGIFKDYRLRIAGVIRDYGMNDRAQAPKDSKAVHNKAQ